MERWAELRREHFVRGVSIKELMRRTGLARNTIRVALRSEAPPGFRCPARLSRLDPFRDEIHALLDRAAKVDRGQGARADRAGFEGGKTIDRLWDEPVASPRIGKPRVCGAFRPS